MQDRHPDPDSTRSLASALLPGLALGVLGACSNGGGTMQPNQAALAFLEIENRLDTDPAGAAVSDRPHILAMDSMVFAVWEDARNGPDRLRFNSSSDGGQTWRPSDVRIPDDPTGLNDVDLSDEPFVRGAGALHVVFEGSTSSSDDDVYYNRSTDGGSTWLPQAIRLDTDTPFSHESDEPRIAIDGNNLCVVWEDDRDGARDIYANRSSDGGLTWLGSDVRLDTDAAGAAESKNAYVAIDGSNVYVVWEDHRSGTAEIFFNRSVDGGATWLGSDVRLREAGAVGSKGAEPKITCNGLKVAVIWEDERNEAWNDVYFTRSMDGGLTWLASDVRLDSHAPGVECENLNFVRAGQRLFVTWRAAFGAGDDIYFTRSEDGGATWLAKPRRMDTDPAWTGDSDDAEMCVQGDSVFVCWEDDRDGEDDVYLNYSHDGGLTWLPKDLRVEQFSGKGVDDANAPQIACSPQGLWVIWEDERNGEKDIYVNGGPLP